MYYVLPLCTKVKGVVILYLLEQCTWYFFTIAANTHVKSTSPQRLENSDHLNAKFVSYLIFMCRYILIHKPTEWTEELRGKFIKFLDKFFELLKCMQVSAVLSPLNLIRLQILLSSSHCVFFKQWCLEV